MTSAILGDNNILAKYDKNIIVFTAYAESGDNEEDYYYDSETLAVIYAKAGEKIELPKVGYSNYKWDDLNDYDGYGSIDGNFYTVGEESVQYVDVEIIGEKLHGSENKNDTKPSRPCSPTGWSPASGIRGQADLLRRACAAIQRTRASRASCR